MQAVPESESDRLVGLVRQAMQAHGSGRFDDARAQYEAVLAADADQPDALHLLGVLNAQRGDLEAAARLIGRAVAVRPAEAMFRNNLGNVEIERGRLDEAEACYLQAIELDPSRLDALNNLGVLLSRRGDAAGAEKVLQRVVEIAPDFADARQNLANHWLREGRLADAVRECTDGLVVAPRSPVLRRTLGLAYAMLGMPDKAIEVYRAWLEADPGNPLAAFHLQACIGEDVPERAPDAYVQRVFDAFAKTFDAKLASLDYQAPAFVVDAVRRHLGAAEGALDVLDAGCGTGLCGPLLKPWARTLAGVDLSEGMLRQAVARRVYDRLVHGELTEYLRQLEAAYDLVASADTLIYFGPLEAVAAAAARALRPGGWLVFTLEAHDGGADFTLHHHGRYSHRREYVDAVLRAAGFEPPEIASVVPRHEAGEPVAGWLVSARAAAAN